MTTKTEKDRAKQIQDKCQTVLNEMLRDDDNKYCVDCDTKGPRWASWNLGVFLCIRCAGIHRNLGVHISKVKSVNLDSWTPEQIVSLQQMGNSRARAVYEANLPDNFRRPQNDSSLESFIRAKYEHKKYIAREWVPPVIPKINWEKEIDEELERQKRKKKQLNETKLRSPSNNLKQNLEIPQIPKPKSASPSTTNTQKPDQVVNVAKKTTNVDLLRLDSTTSTSQNAASSQDDVFSSFLSAPPAKAEAQPVKDEAKLEEENFFNQPAPSEKEKTQLTKDSILALFANIPPNPNVGMYPPTYPKYDATFNPTFAAPAFQQSTYQPVAAPAATFSNFPTNQNQFAMPPSFPQYNLQGNPSQSFPTNTAMFGQNTQAFQPPLNNTFASQMPVAPQGFAAQPNMPPNPFIAPAMPAANFTANATDLDQIFGNLTMNNVTQPKVSTNVWP